MADNLISPIHLKFRGMDADQQTIDAAQFGKSLQGTARFYNSIFLFWFHAQLPKRIVAPPIRVHVGPPKEGSIWYIIYMMMAHGSLPLYPQLLWEMADLAIPLIVKGVFARKTGRGAELDKALDVIADLARQNTALTNTAHQGHLSDKSKMFAILQNLTAANTRALADMASPIGKSARTLTHFDDKPSLMAVLDEPTAEAFTATEEVTVGDQTVYRGKIVGVDKTTGACRFEVEGQAKDLRGKITDPSLAAIGNIYTHALDSAINVEVTAKPVYKEDGEIKTLYISDAKEVR